MSLDKAVKHKKEKREDYRGSERFDRSCRNHGNCGYCSGNRQFSKLKIKDIDKLLLEDELDNTPDTLEFDEFNPP